MSFVQFQVGHYEFSANLIPSLLTLALIPALISLGVWQLNRADQKRLIDKGVQQAQLKAPLVLNELLNKPAQLAILKELVYRKAKLIGQYSNKNFLLDNKTHKGKAGYHVLTPLILNIPDANHSATTQQNPIAVLVNRGWISYQGDRNNIPDIQVNNKTREILGVIKNLPRTILLSEDKQNNNFQKYPKLIQSVSINYLSKELGYQLLPLIIELEKTQNDGFVREWQAYYGSVDRHIAYAFQWFAMAFVLFILFIKINTKKLHVTKTKEDL